MGIARELWRVNPAPFCPFLDAAEEFGLAPDMSFAVVAARQPTSNLLEIDGLPDDVAPTRPGQH
jgi:hypothetical protein